MHTFQMGGGWGAKSLSRELPQTGILDRTTSDHDLEKLIVKIIDWSNLDKDTKQKEKHATLEAWKAGTPSVRTCFIWGEIIFIFLKLDIIVSEINLILISSVKKCIIACKLSIGKSEISFHLNRTLLCDPNCSQEPVMLCMMS